MRILFMGTPDFAVASLKRLVEDGHDVCGVFTQPDRPRNRGKVTFSPVKTYAIQQELPVYQPLKMKDGEALALVRSLAPELIVVTAYGRILPKEILEEPPYGAINVHASILPRYRGAAPINWAMMDDAQETGVSIMYMAEALDAGDVIRTVKTPIGHEEELSALWARLAELGAQALSETIPTLVDGTAVRIPQDEAAATYAPMLSRELSPIDWSRSARQIDCQVRGLQPWPCASTELAGQRLKVFRTAPGHATDRMPGTILSAGKDGIEVACGSGESLYLTEVQAEGGKRMTASAYLLGHPIQL